jgi:hypothetical protein
VKTRGRLVAILGVLGILVALMSVVPVMGATAGTITLSGGVTTDKVIWYSTNAGFDTATVSVTDSDKNVLNPLTGTCTSGTLVDFKCTLVGVAGGTTYSMNHTFLEDANNDDIPDGVLMRALQGAQSGFISTGTSAATGSVVLAAALGTAVHQNLHTAAVAIGSDVTAGATDNALSNYARVRAVVTNAGNVTAGGLETAGIVINGTAVNATTLVETAGSTETLNAATAVADGNLDSTTYWKAGTVTLTVDVNATFAGAFSIQLQELGTVVARYSYNKTDTVTGRTTLVSSAQTAVSVPLTLTETTPSSGIFTTTAVLTSVLADHNTGDPKKVYATDGALLTFTYNDEDPVASKTATARADLKAPTIALTGPTDASFTNVSALTFIVTVTDEASADGKASGITATDVDNIVIAGVSSPALTPLLIGTNSFQVSYSKTLTTQGLTKWWLPAKDKVGNAPAFVAPVSPATTPAAVKGAGDPANETTEPAKPFKVSVDTAAPTIIAANVKTGGKLTTTTVAPITTTFAEHDTSRKNVHVKFDAGTGTAPLDAATLVASAWKVGGTSPSSVAMDDDGLYVVLTMATDQATDAKPKVELSTAGLKDKAGNSVATLTGTSGITAIDDLATVLTVSSDAALAEKSVTVTVEASEALGLAPTVSTTTTEPADGVLAGTSALAVTQTGTTTWTAKFTNATGGFSKQYVVVSGTDTANITSIVGDDSPAKDLISFQVDDAAPTVTFADASGNNLLGADPEEGAIWIVSTFDEDEYTGDSYKTVTVSAMTLKIVSGADQTTAVADLFSSDNKSFTLAQNLTPGTYNFSITAADSAGNSVTSNTNFKVVARVAFSLALKPGVNLVSIPGTAVGDAANLNVLLASLPVTAVATYDRSLDLAGGNPWLTSTLDAETGLFTGDISSLEPGKAYFITASASTTAKLLIEQPSMMLPPTLPVRQGFNAIGFWSISGDTNGDIDAYLNRVSWTVAYTFDPTPGTGWGVIRPDDNLTNDTEAAQGTGYLVYVSQDGTLTP